LQAKGKLFKRIAGMTPQTSPLRIGIIGCGNVLGAYRATIDKLRLRGAAEVVSACGRALQRAETCAALGIQTFTIDAAEVITSPGVDLVISTLAMLPVMGPLAMRQSTAPGRAADGALSGGDRGTGDRVPARTRQPRSIRRNRAGRLLRVQSGLYPGVEAGIWKSSHS
jgi:hypothetical protein